MIQRTTWLGRHVGFAGCVCLLFMWAYWPTLAQVVRTWFSDPDYSHGILVVPIALGILSKRRQLMPTGDRVRPVMWGLLLVAVAGMMRIVGARFYLLEFDVWSIPLWIAGLVWTVGGWRALQWSAPAILYLWFAAPLPERVERFMSLPLQQCAAVGSSWFLQMLGQPAVSAGTTILLGTEVFEVERACSGLRMFLGTFAMATAFCLLSDIPKRYKVLVLAIAPGVAVITNAARIVITAWGFQWTADDVGRALWHDLSGLLMVAIACGLFVVAVQGTRRLAYIWEHHGGVAYRLIPVAFVATLVCGGAVWYWHQRQTERIYATLLVAADEFERASRWDAAAHYLRRYLQLKGNDPAVMSRMAMAITRGAEGPADQRRALTALIAAQKANRGDVRLAMEQARVAMDLNEYEQAIDATRVALEYLPADDPAQQATRHQAIRWQAQAFYDLLESHADSLAYKWSDVAEVLQRAANEDFRYPQHAFRLALVYRERLKVPSAEERNRWADTLIDETVARNPELAEAWLVRYRYQRMFHGESMVNVDQRAEWNADLDRAVALDATASVRNVHVLIAAAERERERGANEASESLYRQAMEIQPQDIRPYLALAELEVERGTSESRTRSVEILQRGLNTLGSREVTLMIPLVEQLASLSREQEADRWFDRALTTLETYSEPMRTTLRIQMEHVRAWRVAKRGKFHEAAETLLAVLESLPPGYSRSAAVYVAQSWGNVGQYFRMAGDWERTADAYQRAAALDEAWRLEYRWARAQANESQGALRDAQQHYEELASETEDPFDAWLRAAGVSLRQQLLLPDALRDWSAFRRALDAARSTAGDRMDQVIVLEANQGLAIHQEERILALLQASIEQYPQSIAIYRTLALLQSRRGQLEQALATAEQLAGAGGEVTEAAVLRAQLLEAARRPTEARDVLRQAVVDQGDHPQTTLLVELARLAMHDGDWETARQALERAAVQDPDDARVTESLSQMAWCLQDWQLLERCETSLRTIEGTIGPLWRTFRIRRILAQSAASDRTDADRMAEADHLARELEELFPHMQQTRIAAGRVATYRGLLWKAVANYEEAWELGVPRVTLAVDLISLLNELGETERAQRYVREIRFFLSATRQVVDESLLDLADESADDAIRMAESIVRLQPTTAAYLRLGRTLVLTALPEQPDYDDRLQRAEGAFREAVRLDPADTRTWAALFRYLVAVRPNPIESQQLLSELQNREEISLLNRLFVLAQLNESIGNTTEAERLYRESMKLSAENLAAGEQLIVLERAAQFFMAHRPEMAEACCRDALKIDADSVGPLQILLQLLLNRRTKEALTEAEQIVTSLDRHWGSGDQGKRWHAELLRQIALNDRTRLKESCVKAIDLLKGLTNKSSSDALKLSELYLLDDQRGAAMSELRIVSEELPKDPQPILEYLRAYSTVMRKDTRFRMLAERLFDQLEEFPDVDMASVDTRIDVALQTQEDRSSDVALPLATVARFARMKLETTEDAEEQLELLGRVFSHLIQTNRAALVRSLIELKPPLLPPPRMEISLARALAQSNIRSDEVQGLVAAVDRAAAQFEKDAELQFATANLVFMFGDSQRAIVMWRELLKRQPHHVNTLNNLALALAQQPKPSEEGEQLIERAIAVEGRTPQLLDSLAVIHLQRGQPREALELLLEAISKTEPDGSLFLHLAKAWNDLGEIGLSHFARTMASSRGIERQSLMPLDQELLDSFAKASTELSP